VSLCQQGGDLILGGALSVSDGTTFSDNGSFLSITKAVASGNNGNIDFDVDVGDGVSNTDIRFFANTTSTGDRDIEMYANAGIQHRFDIDSGDTNLCIQSGKLTVGGPVQLPYLGAAPSGLTNGMIWMESDGLHLYYNDAEKVVAGS
jgi:hypothetical protein